MPQTNSSCRQPARLQPEAMTGIVSIFISSSNAEPHCHITRVSISSPTVTMYATSLLNYTGKMVISLTGYWISPFFKLRSRSAAGSRRPSPLTPLAHQKFRHCRAGVPISFSNCSKFRPLPDDTPVMNAAGMTGTFSAPVAGGMVGQQPLRSTPSFNVGALYARLRFIER